MGQGGGRVVLDVECHFDPNLGDVGQKNPQTHFDSDCGDFRQNSSFPLRFSVNLVEMVY